MENCLRVRLKSLRRLLLLRKHRLLITSTLSHFFPPTTPTPQVSRRSPPPSPPLNSKTKRLVHPPPDPTLTLTWTLRTPHDSPDTPIGSQTLVFQPTTTAVKLIMWKNTTIAIIRYASFLII